jgi:hypothetical protein
MFMICNQDSTGISQNAKWKHEESQEQTERPFLSVNQNMRRRRIRILGSDCRGSRRQALVHYYLGNTGGQQVVIVSHRVDGKIQSKMDGDEIRLEISEPI